MNKINTSQVVDPNILQPFTTKSLNFLQGAYQESMAGLARCLIGEVFYAWIANPGGVAIGGVYPSGNNLGEGFIVASETGAVDEAEIFYYPGENGVLAYPTPIFVIDATNDGVADPVEFSDGVSRNCHNVRRLKVVNQAPGSGMFDYADLVNIKTYPGGALSYGSGWSTYSGRTVQYRLTPMNDLQIKGATQYTWAGSPQLTIGTLPVGYRPDTVKQFVAQVYNSTANSWSSCDIQISTGGVISFGQHAVISVSDVIYVFLDNINLFIKW